MHGLSTCARCGSLGAHPPSYPPARSPNGCWVEAHPANGTALLYCPGGQSQALPGGVTVSNSNQDLLTSICYELCDAASAPASGGFGPAPSSSPSPSPGGSLVPSPPQAEAPAGASPGGSGGFVDPGQSSDPDSLRI